MNFFKHLFSQNQIISDDDYASSRNAFITQGMSGFTIAMLTGGAFVAGFGALMGASKQVIGMLGGLPILAAIVQFFAPLVFERLSRRKPTVVFIMIICRLSMCLMFLLPLLIPSGAGRIIVFGLLLTMAYSSANLITPAFYLWLASLVPSSELGRYMSMRETSIYTVVGIVSVVMGLVMDNLRNSGHEVIGFIVAAILIIILSTIITIISFN